MTAQKRRIVRGTHDGERYEIHAALVSHGPTGPRDVFACYRISGFDGLPMGVVVHLTADEFEEEHANG